jgi:hypothetical protein
VVTMLGSTESIGRFYGCSPDQSQTSMGLHAAHPASPDSSTLLPHVKADMYLIDVSSHVDQVRHYEKPSRCCPLMMCYNYGRVVQASLANNSDHMRAHDFLDHLGRQVEQLGATFVAATIPLHSDMAASTLMVGGPHAAIDHLESLLRCIPAGSKLTPAENSAGEDARIIRAGQGAGSAAAMQVDMHCSRGP